MLVVVLESVQVDFHLRVRKADLGPVSTKEADTLMRIMDDALKVIIGKGYLAQRRVIFNGVMISTKSL